MEVSSIGSGITLAKSGWALLEYLRSVAGADVISAYFAYDGTRIAGSEKIEVERHEIQGKPRIWWFSVGELDDYAFVREPVTPSCAIELVGTVVGEVLPDSRYWRWVAPTLPGHIYIGEEPPNLKVNFIVFGYRPRALLKHFSKA